MGIKKRIGNNRYMSCNSQILIISLITVSKIDAAVGYISPLKQKGYSSPSSCHNLRPRKV